MRCNNRFAGLLLVLSVLMSGCGSEEGTAPALTGVFRPRTLPVPYLLGFNEGEAPLAGQVSFEDPDGDVVLLTVAWQNCGSEPAKKIDIVQEDLNGTRAGEIPFIVVISTNCPIGVYTVNLSVTDGHGYTSNVIAMPYEIKESFQ